MKVVMLLISLLSISTYAQRGRRAVAPISPQQNAKTAPKPVVDASVITKMEEDWDQEDELHHIWKNSKPKKRIKFNPYNHFSPEEVAKLEEEAAKFNNLETREPYIPDIDAINTATLRKEKVPKMNQEPEVRKFNRGGEDVPPVTDVPVETTGFGGV